MGAKSVWLAVKKGETAGNEDGKEAAREDDAADFRIVLYPKKAYVLSGNITDVEAMRRILR